MASLSLKELGKRNNFQTFVSRIRKGNGFYIKNTDILIKLNRSILDNISCLEDLNNYKVGKSIQLPTETNDIIPLSMIYKDSDFSDRTQYSTARQDQEIVNLGYAIYNAMVQTGLDYVPIKITNDIYNVTAIKWLNNKSKADFCLIDQNKNEVGFISHKYGSSPKDFQQWSGTSKRFQEEIFNHQETQSFITDLKSMFNNLLPPASTIARRIDDQRLKDIAVFGNDFGSNYGHNNVEAVMQGELVLKKQWDCFTLSGSHYTIKNGEQPLYGYEPVFMAVHKRDRSDHWVKNCRLTINPIGSRKIKIFI